MDLFTYMYRIIIINISQTYNNEFVTIQASVFVLIGQVPDSAQRVQG